MELSFLAHGSMPIWSKQLLLCPHQEKRLDLSSEAGVRFANLRTPEPNPNRTEVRGWFGWQWAVLPNLVNPVAPQTEPPNLEGHQTAYGAPQREFETQMVKLRVL